MDATRFGLRQRPFRATPDTGFYYPATAPEHALARLLEAIAEDEGLMLLTGAPGTGKTLLCHCLIERIGPDATVIYLTNSHFRDSMGLLQAIFFDLSLPYEGRTEQELRLALTDFLLKNCQAGRRTILVLDEAQHLTPDVLEELRLFGNLEARHTKAFQVILVGQPEFAETLRRPELAGFNQRLAVRAQLEPLDVHEAADYLVYQLRTAGGRPDRILTDEAVALLARATKGLPRLLNQTAYHALGLAQAGETTQVDAEVALEALAAFGLEAHEAGNPGDADDLPPEKMAFEEDDEITSGLDKASPPTPADDGPGSPPVSPPRRLFGPPRRSA